MKKYFAKYLPVEGEIKERDWYKSPSGGILSQHNGSELLPDGWYKVKLFLCSRDVQIGDKVKFIARPDKEIELTQKWLDTEGVGFFKVIGEILTPGIIENQEFTKKEAESRKLHYIEDGFGECYYTVLKDPKQLDKVFKHYDKK